MTELLRLDHVAIAVKDTRRALEYFEGRLGLGVASTEVVSELAVRLTYLDCNNSFLQLVEPLKPSGPVADSLASHGEGLHHVCFSVHDVAGAAAALADPGSPAVVLGRGRGRRSAFVPGPTHFGVRVECTEQRPTDPQELR